MIALSYIAAIPVLEAVLIEPDIEAFAEKNAIRRRIIGDTARSASAVISLN